MERLLRKLGRCSGSQVKSNHINQKQADFSACFFVSKIRLGGNNLENIENKDRVSAPRHYDAAQPAAHHGICRDRYGQGHYDHDQSSVLVHAHTGQRHTVQLPPAGGGRAAALLPRQRTRLPQRYAVILRFLPIPRLPMQTPMPFSKPLLPTAALARWTPRRSPMSSGS